MDIIKKLPLLKFTASVAAPFWKHILIRMGAMTFISMLAMFIRPRMLKELMDSIANTNYEVVFNCCLFYLTISLIGNLVHRLDDWCYLKIIPPIKQKIASKIMKRMLKHSHSLYQENLSGGIANKINNCIDSVPNLLDIAVSSFYNNIIGLFIAMYTMYLVNVRFTIGLIVWATLFCIFISSVANKSRKLHKIAASEKSKSMGKVSDILSNIMSVRLFSASRQERDLCDKSFEAFVNCSQNSYWYILKIYAIKGILFFMFQTFCFYILLSEFKAGKVSVGDFALIMNLNFAIMDCLWYLGKDAIKFSEHLGNLSQGLEIVNQPIEVKDIKDAKEMVMKKGQIVFRDVSFKYIDSEPLFENLNLTIKGGQKVGLVGYSGGGKSTFINLICRIFDVKSGSILIDSQDIRDLKQESLRSHIGVIPQEANLFNRSILENIRYGNSAASDEEVVEVAKKACIHEFIATLPGGYNTTVGERGAKLSGGQRQRIAIARVMLKNPPIIILDEATSQLDSLNEQLIQESLWKLIEDRTTLVIAHRLSTLLNMDRILVFDRGKILQDGSHAELLLDKDGLYNKLWQSQVGGFFDYSKKIA